MVKKLDAIKIYEIAESGNTDAQFANYKKKKTFSNRRFFTVWNSNCRETISLRFFVKTRVKHAHEFPGLFMQSDYFYPRE